jgi:chorismate-pyruvate lyase
MRWMLLAAALALSGCSNANLPHFESVLAANDSATAALGQWCEGRHIAQPAVIRALADRAAQFAPTPAVRAALGVANDTQVAYRHVRLACRDKILSIAHNWYVPERLTPDMNQTLQTTDTPFGKVVTPLGFRRERLAAQRGQAEECPKDTVLSHRAILRAAGGSPISFVVECYTAANLKAAG